MPFEQDYFPLFDRRKNYSPRRHYGDPVEYLDSSVSIKQTRPLIITVVAGGYYPVAFEPVDAAFHGVALLVGLGVEPGWSPAAVGLVLAVADLIGGLRNARTDTASAQPGPVGSRTVYLVGQHPIGSRAKTARSGSRYRDRVEDGVELW